jgi:multidrug resistance efflux pump
VLSKYEQTEDAYAAGNVVQVTPQIAGTVLAVNGDDTEYIEAGKPLIALDKTDSKVAIEQAEAQLAQAVREVRVLFANNAGLQAMADARARMWNVPKRICRAVRVWRTPVRFLPKKSNMQNQSESSGSGTDCGERSARIEQSDDG